MKKRVLALTVACVLVLALFAGCGNSTGTTATPESSTDDGTKPSESVVETPAVPEDVPSRTIKILSIWPEDNDNGKLINDLTKRYIEEVNPNFTYEYELVSNDNLKQKIATLVASNDLPDVFVFESGAPLKELIEAGKVLDMGQALTDVGAYDKLEDGAVSLLKSLSGTEELYDLPLGLNVEGFWYNKALFQQIDAQPPTTWDELITVCDKFMAAGIQPLSAGGADRWPVTRIVNGYAYRSMGADVMDRAAAGEVAYTDPGLIAAAQEIQDMAAKGYFGQGVTTVDQTTAGDMLLSGKSAMFYNGSWFTEQLTADTSPAGPDGIGFFPVPVVDAAISPATEYPMNCGNILAFSKDKYDAVTADWLKYLVSNLGDYAMSEFGAVKGYKYTVEGELSTYSQIVADALGQVTSSTKWWEAAMVSETAKTAQDNVQTLINGDITATAYMESIDESYRFSQM